MNKKNLTIIAVILGLLFLASLIWGITRNSAATEYEADNLTMSAEVDQLEILRARLESQVDSIGEVYEAAAADNIELKGQLSTAQQTTKNALADMRRAQKKSTNDTDVAYQMRLQIEDLINARAMIETNLAELETENQTLRKENVTLRRDLSETKTIAYQAQKTADNMETMNRSMASEIEALSLGNFKATAMQVDLLRGSSGTKVTANASRARRVNVSFDLSDVPEKYLGVRPIYLVMTDQSGTPVMSENPVRAKATVNGAKMDLIALEGRDVNIERSQRLSFTHELDDKLEAGIYRAQIFTDIGFLGAASVNLR
ncbi:hypothetical protein [Neolewinella antarctica]|uniref:Outer membrane murein-binding lipoprotein Lpp n=1 Tax=Neolewinella antarctica TaxID=442734 RepID=A0ABX0XC99_9BACT|nr:hypothetical protein [Neolewinella antarctica]NJC26563.1 outer membrane murein-binding lipoprotein Lpp [Neolewinella antarctica]